MWYMSAMSAAGSQLQTILLPQAHRCENCYSQSDSIVMMQDLHMADKQCRSQKENQTIDSLKIHSYTDYSSRTAFRLQEIQNDFFLSPCLKNESI
jgi:hypothetical protein